MCCRVATAVIPYFVQVHDFNVLHPWQDAPLPCACRSLLVPMYLLGLLAESRLRYRIVLSMRPEHLVKFQGAKPARRLIFGHGCHSFTVREGKGQACELPSTTAAICVCTEVDLGVQRSLGYPPVLSLDSGTPK